VLHRRDLLKTSVASTLLGVMPAFAWGAQPRKKTGAAKFQLSLAAYSFNRQLERNWPRGRSKPGEMTLLDFIDYCGEMNIPGTELTSYYFPKEVTPEYIEKVKQRCQSHGLTISGTAIGNDFCFEGKAFEVELATTRQWVDYAAMMGAPVIRIFAGKVPKGSTAEAAIDRCVLGINESVKYAATKGVTLALENHGGITATPEEMLAIIDRVDDSPYFGVNLDGGNFRTADPYGDLAKIAPYAVNAQVKVAINPNNKGKEPADLERVVQILRDAQYQGFLVLEYEEDNPREEIPKYLDQLRKLI